MVVLPGSGDITAAFGGSITSLMEEPGNRRLLKLFKQQVTRITAVNRFASKYRAKTLQCGIAPASPQFISEVLEDLLQKSNTSEGSKTRNLCTEALNPGALFSPNPPAVQDAPKSKWKLGTSRKKNGEGFPFKMGDFVKDHRALYTIVLTLLAFKILEEADLDEAFGLFIVTLIALDPRQQGTTATYNPVGQTVLRGLLLFLCLITFEKSGVNAQDDSEDGNLERPSEPVHLLYYVQAAAWTFAGIMIAYIAGRINRRPLVPAPAAPLLALPPAAAPPAVLVPIGFVNVMEVLDDNPTAARIGNPDFYIHPPLN